MGKIDRHYNALASFKADRTIVKNTAVNEKQSKITKIRKVETPRINIITIKIECDEYKIQQIVRTVEQIRDLRKNGKCIGLAENGQNCRYTPKEDAKCCARHSDMEDYDDIMFGKLKLCTKGTRNRWRYWEDSDRCVQCQAENRQCQEKIITKNGSHKFCRFPHPVGKRFCTKHHEYLETYTAHMLANRKRCGGCSRTLYVGFFNNRGKQCVACQNRNAENRDRIRKLKGLKKIFCKKYGCKNGVKDGKAFCGVHRLDQRKYDAQLAGKKLCGNYNRNCSNRLPLDHKYSKCYPCLFKDRIQDNNRRKLRKAFVDGESTDTHNCCLECKELQLIEEFITERGLSYNCNKCRAEMNIYTQNRIRLDTYTNYIRLQEIERSAIRRDIEFHLESEEVLHLITQSCHYCNRYYEYINSHAEPYSKMGIDRIDSDKHYTIDNVVTACKVCNRMKWIYGYHTFLNACYNIYKYYGSTNDWEDRSLVKCVSYANHRRNADKRNCVTEISEEQFNIITSKKCFYCNNKNRPNQIGIDRVDSNLGYTADNKLVACCYVCNMMKVDTNIVEFYNNILAILVHHGFITRAQYDAKFNSAENLTSQIERINTILTDNININDRRGIYDFVQPSQYYINKIWSGFNIRGFDPELEFCESVEQMDIWLYYSFTISPYNSNGFSAAETYILVRDKFTHKYVGIASLRRSTKPIGNIVRYKHMYEITTCVALPPFSFNFDGEKLVAMLLFSQEVYDYIAKKKNCSTIEGLYTYALHDECDRYDSIENFYREIYTTYVKDDLNFQPEISRDAYVTMINIMRQKHYPITIVEKENIKTYCANQGIINANVYHTKRVIYFGSFGENSDKYLLGEINMSEPDLAKVSEIGKEWYVKFVIPRIDYLVKHNGFMVEYDYDTHYVDNSGYERNIIKRENRKTHADVAHIEDKKRAILKCWFEDPNNSWIKLETMFKNMLSESIDDIYGCSIVDFIVQNSYVNLDENTKHAMSIHIRQRQQLTVNTQRIMNDSYHEMEMNALINQEYKYIKNTIEDNICQMVFELSQLYITSQKYDNVNMFSRFTRITNIMLGKWFILRPITADCNSHQYTLVKMSHENYIETDQCNGRYFDCESSDIIFKIGFTQIDKEHNIKNVDMLDAPITMYGYGNIFVDVNRTVKTNKLRIFIYTDDTNDKRVVGIKIRVINVSHKDLATRLQREQFLSKYKTQHDIYKKIYLDTLLEKFD